MGLVFRPALRIGEAGSARRPGYGRLPLDVEFLRDFGVGLSDLRAAVHAARQQGVAASEALIAAGVVTDTLYYFSLSRHLGVPWVGASPPLAEGIDARRAVAEGRVRLAGGDWLVAPRGRALRLLLVGRRVGIAPPGIVLAAPSTIVALVSQRAGPSLSRLASEALPAVAPSLSARGAFDRAAIFAVVVGTLLCVASALYAPKTAAVAIGALFLAAMVFRLLVCAAGLAAVPRADDRIPDVDLPVYTVLVPLYDEPGMVGDLVAGLAALDYPPAKLEVLILVEAEDRATRDALAGAMLAAAIRVVVVPDGRPRTKPRALNVGLALARGPLVTVYDAEDHPDPGQLRAAAARYALEDGTLACLQARLAIPKCGSLLQTLFASEYFVLFGAFNRGLARLGLPLPLGGTSNHFRASALRAVGGWDAWNVTEDADLGLRLARFGYRVDVLDSQTAEEAPERLDVWIRQRRRWTKGWMQSLLVLARTPCATFEDLGALRSGAVVLMLVNLVVGPLATPPVVVWLIWRLAGIDFDAPCDPGEILAATMAASVIALGIGSTLWCGWLGLRGRKRALRGLAATLPYQMMICLAAWGGLVDLALRPHHWRKTPHGAAGHRRPAPGAAGPLGGTIHPVAARDPCPYETTAA